MRVSLVVFVLPFYGGKPTPTTLKAALCLVLTLALWPALSFPGQALPEHGWALAIMLFGEISLGLVLYILVNIIFVGVQTGGSLVGFQIGFTMVTVADPMTGITEDISAHFLYMVSLFVFITMNGHLLLLAALADSFSILPPGGLYMTPELGDRVLTLSSQIFVLAVRIAGPAIAAGFLVDLAFALISRAAPQMNLLSFGFPIKILVGLFFLTLLMPLVGRAMSDFLLHMNEAGRGIMILSRQ
jgi:flagellar biosynthetic protein FliR